MGSDKACIWILCSFAQRLAFPPYEHQAVAAYGVQGLDSSELQAVSRQLGMRMGT